MSIARYEIFYKVVESGSLTKASSALNISQSAVSHAIANLEKELGFSLLIRNKGGIKLTENGERMLLYIREILYLNGKMLQEAGEISGLEIGTVRIGTYSSVTQRWMPGLLQRFHELYPDIKIELLEGQQDEIRNWILDGEIDFGFLSLAPSEEFEVLHLTKELLYCLAAASHPLAVKKEISLRELKKEKLILQKSSAGFITQLCKKQKFQPAILFQLEDEHSILSLVKQSSLGISILPEIAAGEPEGVRKIPVTDRGSAISIGIGALSLKSLSPSAEKFIAATTLWLNEHY